MNLERAKQLLQGPPDPGTPTERLIHILEASIELIALEDNDFCWSGWEGKEDATEELLGLINVLNSGALPEKLKVAVLFAPTGPLQELSLSSGWAQTFLKVADKYDEVEALVW